MHYKKLQLKSSVFILCLFFLGPPAIATDFLFESSFEDPSSDCGPPPNIHPGANLRDCDLSGIDLSGADLSGADLMGAILTDADLTGATLDNADLTQVTWSNTTCPDGTNSDDNAGSCVNTPPELTLVTLSPATAFQGSTLTCTPTAFDANGDAVSFDFAWLVNGLLLPSVSINTLSGTHFSRGGSAQCRVTAWDGTDHSAPLDSNLVLISNTPPVVNSVTLLPNPAYEESTLTCSPIATDADSDILSFSYLWSVNSVPVSTSSTLASPDFSADDIVECQVTAFDGIDFSIPFSSIELTISQPPP